MNKTEAAISIFSKRADAYREKFKDISAYSEMLDLFCNSISNRNAAILELACGPGNITRYLSDKGPDFRIQASDLSPEMLQIARKHAPRAVFEIRDCRDIKDTGGNYDGIVCSFGLPYLSKEDSLTFIADAASALKQNGLLYLSVMEDDYSKSGWEISGLGDRIYVYYHEASYLLAEMARNGLQVLDMQRREYTGKKDVVIIELIIVTQKKPEGI